VRARKEGPRSIVAFGVGEETIVVAKIELSKMAEKVAQWNRRFISIGVIRTDLGRIARMYPLGLGWPRNSATR
jgi:hypothetical protein